MLIKDLYEFIKNIEDESGDDRVFIAEQEEENEEVECGGIPPDLVRELLDE